MAKFKIELINLIPNIKTNIWENNVVKYNTSVICDFENLENKLKDKYTFSFDEKFSIHKNSQKELSFSMYKNSMFENGFLENPFVSTIHVGSQLLLTDKYNKTHLFTVTNIGYEITNLNIKYNYTCQDTFNYQLIRQNEGYTINNDPSKSDFIGAKTTDWWIQNKIVPECYIPYKYIPFKEINSSTTKKRYDDILFQETIPFSCSGSNAAASLIDLASKIGCMIHVEEIKNETKNELYRYFWLEPEKISIDSNLFYSPSQNLQNFNFSLSGEGLVTVLNVNSNTINSNEIAMIPEIPPFFMKWFGSNDWLNTKYKDGMFTDKINGSKNYIQSTETINSPIQLQGNLPEEYQGKKLWGIHLDIKTIPEDIHFLKCSWSDHFSIIGDKSNENNLFLLCLEEQINNEISYHIIPENTEIPYEFLTKTFNNIYVAVETDQAINGDLYLNWYRIPSVAEEEFAAIADKCPWLENKLIDFSYFLKQKIISLAEYKAILNFLKNDIRIINGELMFYAKDYYDALHQKTMIISEITNELDKIGAICQADLIDPYTNFGEIDTVANFKTECNNLLQKHNMEPVSILDYNDLINEYFNKGFNNEQKFFKSIKEFEDYFYSLSPYKDKIILTCDLTIQNNLWEEENNLCWYSFPNKNNMQNTLSNGEFCSDAVKRNTNIVPFYEKIDNNYKPLNIINEYNYSKFYKHKMPKEFLEVLKDESYDKEFSYYINEEDYNRIFNNTNAEVTNATKKRLLTHNELKQIYLYKHPNQYYEPIHNWYVPFDWMRYPDSLLIFQNINFDYIGPKNIFWSFTNLSEIKKLEYAWEYYRFNFPINELYVYDYCYRISEWKADLNNTYGCHYQIQKLNAKNQVDPDTTYKKFQTVNFISGLPSGIDEIADLDLDEYLTYVLPKSKSFKFFSGKISSQLKYWFNIYSKKLDDKQGWSKNELSKWCPKMSEAFSPSFDYIYWESYIKDPVVWTKSYAPEILFTPKITINDKVNIVKWEYEGIPTQSSNAVNVWDSNEALFTNSENSTELNYMYTQDALWQKVITEENLFHYFNYYSLLAATYSFEYQNPLVDQQLKPAYNYEKENESFKLKPTNNYKLWVKNNSYYQLLNYNDNLCRGEKYYLNILYQSNNFVCGETETAIRTAIKNTSSHWSMFKNTSQWLQANPWENNNRIGSKIPQLYFYMFQNRIVPFSFNKLSDQDWNLKTTKLVSSLLTTDIAEDRMGVLSDDEESVENYIFYTYIKTVNGRILTVFNIVHEQNYEQAVINNDTTSYINWDRFNKNFLEAPLEGLYNINNCQLLKWTPNFPLFDHDIPIYKKIQDNYNWTPLTKDDLMDNVSDPYFYKKDNKNNWIKAYTLAQLKKTDAPVSYFNNNNTYKQEIILDSSTDYTKHYFKCPLYKNSYNDQNGISTEYLGILSLRHLDYINIHATLETDPRLTFGELKQTELSLTTNSEFWYKYKDYPYDSKLKELSMNIETELSVLWEKAYQASLYSSYFLPSSWNFDAEKTSNNFFKNLIEIDTINETNKLYLNEQFIPKVFVYNKDGQVKWPHYYYKYMNKPVTNNNLSTELEAQFNNDIPFLDSFLIHVNEQNHKEEFLSHFEYDLLEADNYYYTDLSTGMLWKDFIRFLDTESGYSNYTGWYSLMYYILKNNYQDLGEPQYLQKIKEKEQLWKQLYANYPTVLLEKIYSNKDATNSKDLFKMATLAFNDEKNPESQYNLSLIDINSLKGYIGQELTIGTPIKLRTADLYDNFDDIYEVLNKYLFITDISYDLRKDSDINITVNTVKYQEKLLQQLVKLIR